ncbi:FecR family protein [Bacteroides luti]|uniref:FecR family protein n=1 Tax=Bacteroides luti TaxID=1297750 RepID=A0A1M4U5T4_9BACE|nr:FecR family protein [Bacteroides luti]SHE52112.1 FecR family protein [Bacteroides luti]
MKEVELINILEKISSDERYTLSFEEEMHLKEAFSHIPLLDEKPGENVLDEMEERLFSKSIIFEKSEKRIIHWRRYLSVAALIAVLFGCGLWIKSMDMKFVTGNNEQLAFVLPDKSEVKLNENSSVEYNKFLFYFNRNIEMKGEAYYVVTKGRKFTVETPTHLISVLGTRFMVSETDRFDVFCYEGKVLVESLDKREKKILTKGRSFGSDKVMQENQPNWVSHKYVFNSAPLVDVLEALEEEYKVSIENKNYYKEFVFTGTFPTNDISLALNIILAPYNMSWEQVQSNKYRIKNN